MSQIESTVPAAVDGLVAMCLVAPGLDGVQILDGMPTGDLEDDFLAVGISTEEDATVSGDQEVGPTGAQSRMEDYTILCRASSASGDAAMKPRRDRAWQMFSAVSQAVRADMTLGVPQIIRSDVSGGFEMVQVQNDQGAVCTVDFHVHVKISRL